MSFAITPQQINAANPGPINVKWFGAVGDGIADDTAALQAAINYAGSDPLNLYIPSGVYKLTSLLTFTNNPSSISFNGDGLGNSVLYWTTVGGLDIDFPTPSSTIMYNNAAIFKNMSFVTSANGGGVAIDIRWDTAVGDTTVGLIVDNCYIGCINNNLNEYWTTAIKIENGRRCFINKTSINGAFASNLAMTNAIYFTGGSVECHVTDCDITDAQIGINIDHECEGITVNTSNFVNCGIGLAWYGTDPYIGTYLVVHGSHFSCTTYGIIASRCAHGFISNCLFIKRDGSTENYNDIKLLNICDSWNIHDNKFQLRAAGGTEDGIVLDNDNLGGVNDIDLHNNFFNNRDKGIWIGAAGPTNVRVRDNNFNDVTTPIYNVSAGNKNIIIERNYPATVPITPLIGATPSIEGSEFNQFITDNSTPITVTNLLYPIVGQSITIIAGDSNTTIQNNSNIDLEGGIDFVMGIGSIIGLQYDVINSVWHEITRRTP